jgi:chromosome segregation protein
VRLTSIKLAGFKSFVEPTTFGLPGQLVGVVGPNGCGKSNIIDAVRWVLGESRASELRGESMQDVIFNGSTLRKPASRASVELVFNNDGHRAGGQWNQYEEIAVRRVLTRDGTSSYYINNLPVRRRDVQDVFLGTGLGPRAYAIIGQGTINRIVESRPEDLRLFLEEAAGVSKYKERRRETENRLHDTRENLIRVDDILRELNANLEKLERQAVVAEKYKNLQGDISLKQNLLWFLKRAEGQTEQLRLKAEFDKATNELESRIADLRHIEADLESIKQSHYTAGDQLNQSQGALYEATAEVGRLEAEIRFVVEGRQRVEQRLLVLVEQTTHWQTQITTAEEELQNLTELGESAEEKAEILAAQVQDQSEQIPELEGRLQQAQKNADEQRGKVAQLQQQIQVLAAEQRHLEEQSRQVQNRQERLFQDKKAVEVPDEVRLTAMQEQLEEAQQQSEIAHARLEQLQESLPQLEQERSEQQKALNLQLQTQAQLTARLHALRALQEKVRTEGKLAPWLEKHGLGSLTPLWQKLHIQAGWETALEAAMRERMGALEVSRLEMMQSLAQDNPPARLAFYAPVTTASTGSGSDGGHLNCLTNLLQDHDASQSALMADWLDGCYYCDGLPQALQLRSQLKAGESIYVREGHAVGPHSVTFYAADSEQSGLLARAQEIERLDKEVRAQNLMAEEAKMVMSRIEHQLQEINQSMVRARQDSQRIQMAAHDLQVQTLQLSQKVHQAKARSAQLDADLDELTAQAEVLAERKITAEGRFEELDMQLADSQERHAQLDDVVIQANRQLAAAKEQQRDLERRLQEDSFQRRSLQARMAELNRSREAGQRQLVLIGQEQEQAGHELQRLTAVSAQAGLQVALDLRSQREAALAANRSQYDDLTAKLRAVDERRLQTERALDPMRQQLTDLQLKEQAARMNFDQYSAQLAEAGADLDLLAATVEQGQVRLQGLAGEIDRLTREMTALGAVNLAALDELGVARERKQFLDAQTADLQEAIDTLESAIKKIDIETRDLLASTFNTVNEHFGRMFPELFGGGNAKLVMTGDEILDAGVQVQAQPPGKKNQTIHLLSGGEKALTAIALVFAIFQLNPAPFCLLDEVDAPLDDANTERYAKLVARMGKETQFLFISHNKIAMEMAEQLIGVTMQEQGVSRIVAVDMESAVSLTQAA